jgi:hypothetical protein
MEESESSPNNISNDTIEIFLGQEKIIPAEKTEVIEVLFDKDESLLDSYIQNELEKEKIQMGKSKPKGSSISKKPEITTTSSPPPIVSIPQKSDREQLAEFFATFPSGGTPANQPKSRKYATSKKRKIPEESELSPNIKSNNNKDDDDDKTQSKSPLKKTLSKTSQKKPKSKKSKKTAYKKSPSKRSSLSKS